MHPLCTLSLRRLCAVALLAAVCLFNLPSAAAWGQDQAGLTLPAKPDRDAPFPLGPEGWSAGASASPAAAPSVDQWSKLVFQTFRDGNWEVYLAGSEGSAPANLSQHPAADARPQLNLGSTRVLFNSDRDVNVEIYAADTDGSGLTRLTYNDATDYAAAWSPDGSRTVFVSNRTGNNELFVMNADGSSPVQLTYATASDSSPAWSPDGKWIAWKRTSGVTSDLLMMHPDGSEFTLLRSGLRYAGSISWSPSSSRLLTDADVDGDNWNELIEVSYESGGWIMWTRADVNQPFVDLWAGSYAPDSSAVVYTLVQYVVSGRQLLIGRADLLRLDLSSGEISVLPGAGSDMNPSWMSADAVAPTSSVDPLPSVMHAGLNLIHLQGADTGPGGLRSFDVQYATAADGPWSKLADNLKTATTYLPAVEPGSTIWLRSRATDYAGNVEAWPSMPDAGTQVYAWDVRGRSVDNRGFPVPNQALTSSPDALMVRSNTGGAWQILYTTEQTYTLGAEAPGFSAAAPSALNLNTDAQVNLFLPPAAELLQNGGFEDSLNGWTGDSILVAGGLAQGAHSGSHGLLLGSGCALPCLSSAAAPELPSNSVLSMVADGHGNLHVVVYVGDSSGALQLFYLVHSVDTGLWSEPQQIGQSPLNGGAMNPVMAVDGQGALHVAFGVLEFYSWPKIPWYYLQKTPDGAWTPITPLTSDIEDKDGVYGSSFELTMVGDPVAGVHVILDNRVYLRSRTPGIWSSGLDLYPRPPFSYMPYNTLGVGRDGVVHIISDVEYKTLYRSLSPQGVLSAPFLLSKSIRSAGATRLFVSSNGALHLSLGRYYMYRSAAGLWTEPESIVEPGANNPTAPIFGNAWLDGADTLHFFGRLDFSPPVYMAKLDDTGWLPLQSLETLRNLNTTNQMQLNHFTVAPNGLVQILHKDDVTQQLTYWSSPLGSTGVISTVSQVVTLPAQMVHPTLSFFHKALSGDPAGAAQLSVAIDDGTGSGATTVYSTSAAATWTQASVDMAPWLGKTVTVTFAVEQADGEPLLSVYLDDISLGPWTTPVIDEVTPAQVYARWDGAQITVRGDNFTGGSTLRLGDTALPASFGDDHTLQATVPAGLPAGRYDLWVQNPDGQQNVALGGLTLGGWGYLPQVRK